MLARLALLFVLVPMAELALLIQVGQWVGLWPTLGLVVVTGIAGAALARREGIRTFLRFQRELSQGRLPGQSLFDGLAILLGGAFLLTPGLLTDVLGFSLVLPPTRRLIQRSLRERFAQRLQDGTVQVEVLSSHLGSPPSEESPPVGLD